MPQHGTFDTAEAEEEWQDENDQSPSRTPEQWDDSGALQMQISCVAQQTQSLLALQTRSEVHMQALEAQMGLVAQQVQMTEHSSEQLSGALLQMEEKQAAQQAVLQNIGSQQKEIAQKLEKTLSSIERRQEGRSCCMKDLLGVWSHMSWAFVGRWHPREAVTAAAKSLMGTLPKRETDELHDLPLENSGTLKKDSCTEGSKKKKGKKSVTVSDDGVGGTGAGLVDVEVGASVSRLQRFVLGSLTLVSLISVSTWMFPRADQSLDLDVPKRRPSATSDHTSRAHTSVSVGAPLHRSSAEVSEADHGVTTGGSLATIDASGSVKPNPTPRVKIQKELIMPFLNEIGFTSLNARDDSGLTVLHYAIRFGRTALAMALLKGKEFKKLNTKDSVGWTVFHEAAVFGSTKVVITLLDMPHFTGINAQDNSGRTALHLAASKGHIGVVKALLEHGPFTQVNEKDNDGRTALHHAVYFGQMKVVKQLMNSSRFTELNALDEKSWTALHYAATSGYYEVAIAVMNDPRFTKVNAKDHVGRTALYHAATYGHMTILMAILKHPDFTELNGKDEWGFSVLHGAASHGHADIVNALLRRKEFDEVQAKDHEGWTALHHAANGGHMDVVEVLLKSGRFTEISAKDAKGKSALDLADEHGHFVVASALRKHLSGGASRETWVTEV